MKTVKNYFKNLYNYKDLIHELVSRNLKLKYRRSILGYLWTILNPLLIMLVITLVFSMMFKNNIPNFPVYMIIGRTVFDCINEASHRGMASITGNAALLKKTYVPKYIFVFSEITTCMVNFVLSLGALVIVMIITKTSPSWYLLLFPFVIIQLYIFNLGFGAFLAQANVFFRDVTHIYNAFSTAWMYLTPIFYPVEILPDWLHTLIALFNPMYFYIEQMRNIILYKNMPSLSLWCRGWIAAFVMFAIGNILFKKNQNKFILYV